MIWSKLAKKDSNGIFLINSNNQSSSFAIANATSDMSNHLQSDVDYNEITKLISDIKNTKSDSKEYYSLPQANLLLNHLYYPEAANNLRAFSTYFNYAQIESVLMIGALSTTSVRFLAERVKSLSVIDFDYNRLRLSVDRCQDLNNVNYVFSDLSDIAQWSKFDLVICEGSSDFSHYWQNFYKPLSRSLRLPCETHKQFINDTLSLVSSKGSLLVMADNAVGEKYILGATDERSSKSNKSITGFSQNDLTSALTTVQWRNIFSELKFCYKEFYLFPDFRFTEVLLGQDYVESNVHAWQHLDRVHAKEYLTYKGFEDSEHLLLAALSKQHCLGLFANSLCYILDKSTIKKPMIDFVHLPRFERQDDYLNIVQKFAEHENVQRISFKTKEVVSTERFVLGNLLSVYWIDTLLQIQVNEGFDKCNVELRNYYQFLLQLDEGFDEGLNIDCLPNNIIVDDKNNYHVIDKEWLGKFDCSVELVFYRGVWLFLNRYLHFVRPHLYKINVRTVREFMYHAFYQVGIHLDEIKLDKLYQQDTEFLSHVSGEESSYDLDYDLTTKEIDNSTNTDMTIKLSYLEESDEGSAQGNKSATKVSFHEIKVLKEVSSQSNPQTVTFDIPKSASNLTKLVFWPYLYNANQVCFDISKIELIAESENKTQRVIWSCATQDDVIANNKQKPLSTISRDGNEIIFLNHIFDNLSFDLDNLIVDTNDQLLLKCTLIFDFHPVYQMIKDDYLSVKNELEKNYNATLGADKARFSEVLSVCNNLENELNDIKESRVWRLVNAYSEIFKIENFPKKNIFQKGYTFFKRALMIIKR